MRGSSPFGPAAFSRPDVLPELLEPRRLLAADLVVADVALAPTLLGGPGTLRPLVVIRNVGDTRVDRSWTVRYAASVDDEWGNDDDVALGRSTRAGLLPGGTVLIADRVRVSSPGLADGTYHLAVFVDANSAVGEANETNNIAATSLASITAFASRGDGPLVINGTGETDDLTLTIGGGSIRLAARSVGPGGVILPGGGAVVASRVTSVRVNGGAGNDSIVTFAAGSLTIDAGGGDDRVASGSGNDLVIGGPGDDRLFGAAGDDRLVGGGGRDRLYGEAGNDTLSGGNARDLIFGGAGNDWLIGGAGDDHLFAFDNQRDTVSGNAGNDLAQLDPEDEELATSVVATA